LLASPRGLNRGIERQDVGLEGNAVDHTNDVADLAAAFVDASHRLRHLFHHFSALQGDIARIGG
jgi:hypothetical protein